MNKQPSKKIDLKERITEDLISRSMYIDPKKKYMINYFLGEDLEATLGKTQFDDESEISVTRTRGGLDITTIFDANYRVMYRTNGVDVYELTNPESMDIKDMQPVRRAFSLTVGPDLIQNNIAIKGEENIQCDYEVNINDQTFKYSCGVDGETPKYKGSLSCLNAKFNSGEAFAYERVYPPIETEKSFFRRLARNLFGNSLENGEGMITVNCHDSYGDYTDLIDRIFAVLKEESTKAMQQEKVDKELQLKSEE